ncbi:MAG: hypothetical protein IKS32_10910 [Solobacterium sp.]|nr:hypothetical protein [Solobacterium sp.]
MGFFHKHDGRIAKAFLKVMELGKKETESEFLDSLNLITVAVEKDDSYTVNEKLKIYELLTMIANVSPAQRPKYAKRLVRILE